MQAKLENTLQELHEQLTAAADLSDEQRELLRTTLAEIQAALEESPKSTSGLGGRLQEAALELESTHPALTNAVGRVADLLSQIGI